MSPDARPRAATRLSKMAIALQIWLIRHNLMGPLGNFIMVLTTTGRKSQKAFSTPVAYVVDGATYVGMNDGKSNWYKNIQVHPVVTLVIKGKKVVARAQHANTPEEKAAIFELFRQKLPSLLPRVFGVQADAPQETLEQARDGKFYVRYYPTAENAPSS